MAHPDAGMFSIKLIHPAHLKYPYFTENFDGKGDRWPLMNFAGDSRGRAIAAKIPIGHRSLVYVNRHQKFVWAIEYIGTLEDGTRSSLAHGITPNDITTKWNIYRPIRFIAKIDLASAPTAEEIARKTGIRFKANSFTLKYISAGEYQGIYDAIDWQVSNGLSKHSPLPLRVTFDHPPIPNPEAFLKRIHSIQGLPERNMEDVVKAFFMLLGYSESSLRFQIGHVDVRLDDDNGRTQMVIEVKRSLLIEKAWRDARRKGFDYASETGAPLVVVTDADIYEIYDRRHGHDYDSMLVGRFQLTRFAMTDNALLDVLRPKK